MNPVTKSYDDTGSSCHNHEVYKVLQEKVVAGQLRSLNKTYKS